MSLSLLVQFFMTYDTNTRGRLLHKERGFLWAPSFGKANLITIITLSLLAQAGLKHTSAGIRGVSHCVQVMNLFLTESQGISEDHMTRDRGCVCMWLLISLSLFYVCVWVLVCMYVCAPHGYLVPAEARRIWKWRYWELGAAMWMLGFSARAANLWAGSPVSVLLY